jgi:hypothetical protein
MSWLGLYGFAWNDYDTTASAAFLALVQGHVARFVELLPHNAGSFEMRAPFALVPGLFGGGELAVYRAVSIPCLLVGAAFGVWLVGRMRDDGHPLFSRAVALGLCVANPITLQSLEFGHAEQLLGAVLCVAAVLLAARDRPIWAGLLLGLAIANKQWAVLALGPVLLAFPSVSAASRPRLRMTLVAVAVAVIFLAPSLIVSPGTSNPGITAVLHTGTAFFNPEQAFWFAGASGHVVRGGFSGQILPGFRTPPGWLDSVGHLVIIAVALPLTLLCLRRRRPERRLGDALLLLTLLLLVRCVLDPWDFVYYPLPFILALLVWETTTRREAPVFALSATAAVWAVFVWLPQHATPDVTSAAFMALAVPGSVALGVALYGRRQPGRKRSVVHGQSMTARPRTDLSVSRRPATPS